MVTLFANGDTHSLNVDADMPLLWALHDAPGLIGTQYGCAIAVCGPSSVLDKSITPIEKVSSPVAEAVQSVREKHDVVPGSDGQSNPARQRRPWTLSA
ncbi:hypothetical protein [Thiohalophilus sp.]|uniref:hypothetical protein n=1 Tax=Thiohalophilus sp. TaxID=3028392 RepID=UPI002ACE6AE8|nr:hypothetical protein [Thiohalophilus sp.]MDZ7663489.1 hypothetical protein [Thiohalophilus sp.]